MASVERELTIAALVDGQMHRLPTGAAVLALEQPPLTYENLYRHMAKVVAHLRAMGIQRGDRVAVALPNGTESAVAFLSITCAATYAPLNPNYRASEYEFYLNDLNAKALILQSGTAEAAREVALKMNIPVIELSPADGEAAGIFTLSNPNDSSTEAQVNVPANIASEFATADDIALILHTSGTTSRPKMVPLSHANLCRSAGNVKESLALSQGDRCLNVMPLFHIHGLIGALLSSIAAGASVVCTPGFYAPRFLDWLHTYQATWYSAVPTMHQQILGRAVTTPPNASIRLIRSSSAPLPPQVMAELEAVFDAPVIESYGMTEAAHQMASNPLPPEPRKPGSVGIAAGLEVQIMDEKGDLLPVGAVGEVVIRGQSVTQGYENNPTANATAFTNGWFRTGDIGSLDAEGYLFLKGRIKEIINRGGEKISPREVDEALLDHPAVEQVVTFAAPHTLLGEDVAAAVVIKPEQSVSEQALKEFASERLADYKIPRVVLFLDEIPKGPTGKRQRIGLAKKLGLTTSDPTVDRAGYVAPRTPVEESLVSIWSEVLAVGSIGVYDNFFQLGGDSILATQIINRVREVLHVDLSFVIFFQQPTLENMALVIVQQQAQGVDADDMEALLGELELV